MNFQIRALAPEQFQPLLLLEDAELAKHRAVRERVRIKPGAPCRVSLADAEVGEEVLLLHYTHQPADSPFHASHGIYIRPGVQRASPVVNEIPEMLYRRTLSVRAFDERGMMTGADLASGTGLHAALARMLGSSAASYLHLHFAGPGCYAARVDRAG